jgi:hypothetical protein
MEFSGINPCYWWIGQITDAAHWQPKVNTELHQSSAAPTNAPYKVNVIGRNSASKDVADSQTFNAYYSLPTTAGGGGCGTVQTKLLTQGTWVHGIYKDGHNGNELIITGVIPNNPGTFLFQGDPDSNFVSRSGFTGLSGSVQISNNSLEIIQNRLRSNESVDPNVANVARKDQFVDGSRFFYVPKPKRCGGAKGELKGIQKKIGEVIALVNILKSGLYGTISDLQGAVSNQLNKIKQEITTLTKNLFGFIRTNVINKINQVFISKLRSATINQIISYNDQFEKVTDVLLCLFTKAINKLKDTVATLVDDIANMYLNAPLCAAEAFLAQLISGLFDDLTNGINTALESLGISEAVGSIFSGLSIVTNILSFLTCEEKLNCEMPEQWSIFGGTRTFLDDSADKLSDKIAGIGTAFDLSDGGTASCSVSQTSCGPPELRFVGTSLSAASGNPIISATGQLLGIDLVSGGFGYSEPPTIEIVDKCGNGSGAVVVPIMNYDSELGGSVESVVVVDSGIGYLSAPDGSTGGNGYVYSYPNDTIIFDKNLGFNVYPCSTTVNVSAGNKIYLKAFANVTVYDAAGVILQEITGKGMETPITINFNGSLTTPPCQDSLPVPQNSYAYQVGLGITNVAITNKGINYTDKDTIEIIPSNGAEMVPKFDENGSLVDVIVTQQGIGFTSLPEIRINSTTGINASVVPIFNIIRVNEIKEDQDLISIGTPVVNVVDCVGVVYK